MENFNEQFYKKSGIVIAKLSRDILCSEIGSKLMSVAEYAAHLEVSRGVVQKAISYLEERECVKLDKSHGTGTFLLFADIKKLCETAGWENIIINLPVPSTESLSSLTTALYKQTQFFSLPIGLVYATGSENRIHYLKKNIYDAILVSLATAKIYTQKYSFLPEPIVLEGCTYATPFYAYFANPSNKKVTNGMRVAIDYTSSDYCRITQDFCSKVDVEFIETPLIAYSDALKSGKVDLIIHRKEAALLEFEHLNPQPVTNTDISMEDFCTPALLFNKEQNYGMRRFFAKHLHPKDILSVQEQVLSGQIPATFY